MGEWILRNYARATQYIGLHFKQYDDFILPPVIKKDILQAEPQDKGYITVYLSSYSDATVRQYLHPLKEFRFQVFSKEVKQPVQDGNILFIPVSKSAFNKSLINCSAILTGAGFETPAEALYLGKKLLVIPIRGQYEQFCNAAALAKMGVPVLDALDSRFEALFRPWMEQKKKPFSTWIIRRNLSSAISCIIARRKRRMRWICCIRMPYLIRTYFRYAAASDGYAGANDVFGWPAAAIKLGRCGPAKKIKPPWK
jgi:hypothetical protein